MRFIWQQIWTLLQLVQLIFWKMSILLSSSKHSVSKTGPVSIITCKWRKCSYSGGPVRVSDHWVQRTSMAFDKWAPMNKNISTLYTPRWKEIQFPKHSLKKLKMMVILQNNNHTHMYIRLLSSTLWHPVVCSVSNV